MLLGWAVWMRGSIWGHPQCVCAQQQIRIAAAPTDAVPANICRRWPARKSPASTSQNERLLFLKLWKSLATPPLLFVQKNTTWCLLTFKYHSAAGWRSTPNTKQRRGSLWSQRCVHTDELKPCWSLAAIEDRCEILQSLHSRLRGPDCVRAALVTICIHLLAAGRQPSKEDGSSFSRCFP